MYYIQHHYLNKDIHELIRQVNVLISKNNKTFSNDAIIAFLGGFSGALFAFLFDRLAAYLSKRRERYMKHKNAVIRMEYILVKHQDKINRLIYLLKGSIDTFKRNIPTNNRFNPLNEEAGIELELGDIDLINEVSNYWLTIERVNNDCDSFNRMIVGMQTAMLSGIKIHNDMYKNAIEQMEEVIKYLKMLY